MISIYGIVNPINNNRIFYVGASKYPEGRLSSHISESKKYLGFKNETIAEIIKCGCRPEIKILEECVDDLVRDREEHYISLYSADNGIGDVQNQLGYSTYPFRIVKFKSYRVQLFKKRLRKRFECFIKVYNALGVVVFESQKIRVSQLNFNTDTVRDRLIKTYPSANLHFLNSFLPSSIGV